MSTAKRQFYSMLSLCLILLSVQSCTDGYEPWEPIVVSTLSFPLSHGDILVYEIVDRFDNVEYDTIRATQVEVRSVYPPESAMEFDLSHTVQNAWYDQMYFDEYGVYARVDNKLKLLWPSDVSWGESWDFYLSGGFESEFDCDGVFSTKLVEPQRGSSRNFNDVAVIDERITMYWTDHNYLRQYYVAGIGLVYEKNWNPSSGTVYSSRRLVSHSGKQFSW